MKKNLRRLSILVSAQTSLEPKQAGRDMWLREQRGEGRGQAGEGEDDSIEGG